jgi:hypothetical protein
MSEDYKITVFYEKFYTDDTGKHIPDLFSKNKYDNICVKSYWGNTIDAFYRYGCLFMFTAITGDFRIVIANEDDEGYTFNQYFISGLDGKVIKIPKNVWFGINNINSDTGSLVMGRIGSLDKFDTMEDSIFEWHSKR